MAILKQPIRKSAKARDRARAYTGQWQRVSQRYRRRHPVCERCNSVPSAIVDHIVPLAAGGQRFDPNNLQALCRRCHGFKTVEDKDRYPEVYHA